MRHFCNTLETELINAHLHFLKHVLINKKFFLYLIIIPGINNKICYPDLNKGFCHVIYIYIFIPQHTIKFCDTFSWYDGRF